MTKNTPEKTSLTILWLTEENDFTVLETTSPALGIIERDLNFRIEIIFEKDILPKQYVDTYEKPNHKFLDRVEKLTARVGENQIDIVVIGNNLGSGLIKALAINCMKVDFTVIVYSIEFDEKRYREMGFSNICKRSELGDKLI